MPALFLCPEFSFDLNSLFYFILPYMRYCGALPMKALLFTFFFIGFAAAAARAAGPEMFRGTLGQSRTVITGPAGHATKILILAHGLRSEANAPDGGQRPS